MSQFITTRLSGGRALIEGTDFKGVTNSVVVDTAQWDEVTGHTAFSQATADFDAAVEKFFAPLEAAADKLKSALERPTDATSYVVLQEGQDAQPAVAQHIVKLNRDSILLRIVEQGDFDRLMWVKDQLEVLEVPAPATTGVSVSEDGADS